MSARNGRLLAACGLAVLWLVPAFGGSAPAPYPPEPGWTSGESTLCGTGLAMADLDGDGFEDLIVSNGNDLAEQPLLVYHNDGMGKLSTTPWRSELHAYFGNLAVGDVNGDGLLDVVVATNTRSQAGITGVASVFLNHGGELAKRPDYTVGAGVSTLSCVLGDVDGDGDLDLAMAAVATEQGKAAPQLVFFNKGGRLSKEHPWRSSDAASAISAQLADVNGDGLLDLIVGAGVSASSRVYLGRFEANRGIGLNPEPDRSISNPTLTVLYLDFGRISGMGPALALSNNSQRCTGECAAPYPQVYPVQQAQPVWQSKASQIGGGMALADVNGDGHLDLLTATWTLRRGSTLPQGGPVRIFRGTEQGLETSPFYESTWTGVGETLALADLRHAGLHPASERFELARPGAVVSLSRQVISRINQVRRNGKLLKQSEWTSVPGRSWISFARPLVPGDTVEVEYVYSTSLDVGITNCGDAGSVVYYHE